MNITVIHGQAHKGSTYQITQLLIERLGKESHVTEFFLPTALPHFCIGCYRCIEEENACPFQKEKNIMLQSIKSADLLIFTTPTYCLRASAPMKSFIDLTFTNWMPHRPKPWMFHKKAVVLSTAAGSGAKQAIKDIKTCLSYWGISYIKTYGTLLHAANWESVSEKKKAVILHDMSNLANQIKQVTTPHVGLKTKLIFEGMRMMQKKGMGSSPHEKQYWEEQGWLGKHRPWKQPHT